MQIAQQLHDAGVRVFPCTSKKRPATKGWQSPLHPTQYQWPSDKVGVPIPAGVYVVDLDVYKGVTRQAVEQAIGCALPWDEALVQRTANGGEHYAFSHAGATLMQGVDLFSLVGFDTRRAGAGFIVTGGGYTPAGFGVFRLGHPAQLPQLPPAAALALMKPEREAEKPTKPLSEQEVADAVSALGAIDPGCGRGDWWQILAAARHLTAHDPERGLQIFNEWSAGEYSEDEEPPANYAGPDDIEHQWFSTGVEGGIAGGTLFHKAMEAGWRPPAGFDVAAVFGQGAAPSDQYCDLIDDIIANAVNGKETPRLLDLVLAFSGSASQSAALKATLMRELKDNNLLTKEIKAALDGANYAPTTSVPAPTAGQILSASAAMHPSLWAPHHTKGKDQKPKATRDNFDIMLRSYGVQIQFDELRKELKVSGPGVPCAGILHDEAALAHIDHLSNLNDFPKADNRAMIMLAANENTFNPVVEYVNSAPWDGFDYIGALFGCLRLAPEEDPQLAEELFRRWFLGAVAIGTGRAKAMENVLTLVDPKGGAGKTRFFCTLAPEDLIKDGVVLDSTDRDSVKIATSYWLVELGELDGTFSRSEASKLKAFLTNSFDEMRLAYGRAYMKYPRRTAYFASVNSTAFLPDSSGNRRFWPIQVEYCNHEHGINVQQAWAQAQACINSGHRWHLTPEENDLITLRNEDFRAASRAVDLLSAAIDTEAPPVEHVTVTAALSRVGFANPNKSDLNEAARWLRSQGYAETKRQGTRGFMIPRMTTPIDQAFKPQIEEVIER